MLDEVAVDVNAVAVAEEAMSLEANKQVMPTSATKMVPWFVFFLVIVPRQQLLLLSY